VGPILLVDDYSDARQLVREALENAGYRVVEAANGMQALHLLVGADEPFQLVILDLQMPVMDGWQLLQLLRRYVSLSKIPVILVTAHDCRLEQLNYPSIFAALHSPYSMTDLVDTVDACMSGVRAVAKVTDKGAAG
jgi:CheY-like chemotaxis protein